MLGQAKEAARRQCMQWLIRAPGASAQAMPRAYSSSAFFSTACMPARPARMQALPGWQGPQRGPQLTATSGRRYFLMG